MLQPVHREPASETVRRERLRARLVEQLDRPVSYPLSHAQQTMWWLHRWAPESAAYNQSVVFVLRGALDLARLERALDELVVRHETLRTAYTSERNQPVQVVHPARAARVVLERVSLADEEQARTRLAAELARPFDLEQAPALRALAITLPNEVTVLCLAAHHISIDGWSAVRVLTPDLKALYEGKPLPPLSVQYKDYALWDRRRAERGEYEASLKYWRARLEGAPALTDLPCDHARGPVQSFAGGRVHATLDAATFARFDKLCRELDVGLAAGLLAACKLTLARWTGQQDQVTGMVAANRTRPELERLSGNFIQFVPVRAHVLRDVSFAQLAREVNGAFFEARAHEACPFSLIVDKARTQTRSTGHNPIYNVALLLHRFPTGSQVSNHGFESLDDASLRALFERCGVRMGRPLALGAAQGGMGWVDNDSALLDLRFLVFPFPDGTALLECEYSSALLERDTAQKVLAAFHGVLTQVGVDATRRVRELSGFSELDAQREQARRAQVAQSVAPEAEPVPTDSPVFELLQQSFAEVLDREAVDSDENFFAAGGDSMRALQLISLVEERAGIELSVAVLNEHATLRRLHRVLLARLVEADAEVQE